MPLSASAAPSASPRRGWQRLAILAGGVVTATGALVAIAAPAPAGPRSGASAVSSHHTVQDCRGPFSGSGGRACEEPTAAEATGDTVQDCRGPLIGSGGRACEEPTAAEATGDTVQEPEGALALTTNAVAQACGGGSMGSGGRACDEPAVAPAQVAVQTLDDGGGLKGGGTRHVT